MGRMLTSHRGLLQTIECQIHYRFDEADCPKGRLHYCCLDGALSRETTPWP